MLTVSTEFIRDASQLWAFDKHQIHNMIQQHLYTAVKPHAATQIKGEASSQTPVTISTFQIDQKTTI